MKFALWLSSNVDFTIRLREVIGCFMNAIALKRVNRNVMAHRVRKLYVMAYDARDIAK